MIERRKMTRATYQALKRYILLEREKKKQGGYVGNLELFVMLLKKIYCISVHFYVCCCLELYVDPPF